MMKSQTEAVFKIMTLLSWIAFIGLLIKAGAMLFSFILSLSNPEAAKNLYDGMDFYNLRQYDRWHYALLLLTRIGLELLKAYIALLVIKVLSVIKLTNPFTPAIVQRLENISYFIFGAWVTVLLYNSNLKWIDKKVDGMLEKQLTAEFILLAGVIFIFSQVFKKGVELQTENDLTI
jgi:hypothetical protein